MKNDKFWWMVGVFMMSALFAFSLPAAACTLTWEHTEPETVDSYTLYWEMRGGVLQSTTGTIGMDCPFDTRGRGHAWVTASNSFGESEPSNRLPFGVPASVDAFRFE